MKKSYKFISVTEIKKKLDNASFDYTWVFSNGVADELSENSRFKQYLKRIFLSNDSNIHRLKPGNKLYNDLPGKFIKPKRKWILFEQLQIL